MYRLSLIALFFSTAAFADDDLLTADSEQSVDMDFELDLSLEDAQVGTDSPVKKSALAPQFDDEEDSFDIDMSGVSLEAPNVAAPAVEDEVERAEVVVDEEREEAVGEEEEIEEIAQPSAAAKDVEWSLDLDSEEEVDLTLGQFRLGDTEASSAPVDISFDEDDEDL